jgi:hypothetical protein
MSFERVSGTGPDDSDYVEYGRGLGYDDARDFEVNDFDLLWRLTASAKANNGPADRALRRVKLSKTTQILDPTDKHTLTA